MLEGARKLVSGALANVARWVTPSPSGGAPIYEPAINPSPLGAPGAIGSVYPGSMTEPVTGPATFPIRAASGATGEPDLQAGARQFHGLNADDARQRLFRWREYWDPLPWLTGKFAREIEHSSQLGLWSDLQWVYWFIEQSDGLLLALLTRRLSAISKLKWHALPLPKEQLPKGCSEAEAQEQADCLGSGYNGIGNLSEALEWLALAPFRKFSHLEIIVNGSGQVCNLSPVDQWHFKRYSMHSPWIYDPAAFQSFAGTPIDPGWWVIREVKWPIHRVSLPYFILTHGGQERWKEYCEIYGLPGAIIFGPPDVPKNFETQYQSSAEAIARGGSGYMPHGSDAKFHEGPRQSQPFADLLIHWERKLTLAATGGLLTSLAESGTGSLAGGAHQATFDAIALAEGLKIAECLDSQLSSRMITPNFPGRPILARFELRLDEEKDPAAKVDEVQKLTSSGFDLDPEQVTAETGWRVTKATSVAATGDLRRSPDEKGPGSPGQIGQSGRFDNRGTSVPATGAAQNYGRGMASDLAPIRQRLAKIIDYPHAEGRLDALAALVDEFPGMIEDNTSPGATKALAAANGRAFVNGFEGGKQS